MACPRRHPGKAVRTAASFEPCGPEFLRKKKASTCRSAAQCLSACDRSRSSHKNATELHAESSPWQSLLRVRQSQKFRHLSIVCVLEIDATSPTESHLAFYMLTKGIFGTV